MSYYSKVFFCLCLALEHQIEEQKRLQSLSWLSQSQALSSVAFPSTPPAKRPPKRPRLQRPASTTVLGTSVAQPLALQPQQFTVLSPITLSSIGQSFAVAGLAQPSNTLTLHALPPGSQLFTRISTAPDGKTEAVALHPASGLTLLGTAAVQDHGQLGTVVSPVELLQLTQKRSVAQDGQVVAGTVVMQEGVVRVLQEDENQANATLIEIDPSDGDHGVSVMELQLDGSAAGGEEEECGATVVQGDEEVVRGEVEEEIQLEANGQFHNLPVVVVEEETQDAGKAK